MDPRSPGRQLAVTILGALLIVVVVIVAVTVRLGPTSTAELEAREDVVKQRIELREERQKAREEVREQRNGG